MALKDGALRPAGGIGIHRGEAPHMNQIQAALHLHRVTPFALQIK